MYLSCFLDFRSQLSLEELGAALSENIFGGIPFGSRDEAVRDEVPAIQLKKDVLGFYVVLHGFGGDNGYTLEMFPRKFDWGTPGSEDQITRVNFAPYLKGLVAEII